MLRQKSHRPTKNSAKIGADVGRQSADVARFSKILLADRRPTVGLGNVTVVLKVVVHHVFGLVSFIEQKENDMKYILIHSCRVYLNWARTNGLEHQFLLAFHCDSDVAPSLSLPVKHWPQ